MKKLIHIRKINRGIMLAVILLIGLIAYLLIDNARFDSERIAIRQMLNDYAEAAENMNILPESEWSADDGPSDAAIQNKLNENKVIINRYLTNWYEYDGAKKQAEDSFNELFKQNGKRHAFVTKAEYTVKSINKIEKNGPQYVKADFTIQVKLETIGKPQFFTMCGTMGMNGDLHSYYDPSQDHSDEAENIDDTQYTYTMEYTLREAQLAKRNGQWKIAFVNCWSPSEGKLVEK